MLNDDTVVDQRSVPAPRDLYLRLARAKAFPSNKIGKRVCARWGDIRAALLGGPSVQKATPKQRDPGQQGDNLNELRRQLNLVEKG